MKETWIAEVSDLIVTIDEDNFKNFEIGNKVTVDCNGEKYTRTVRDFPEDIGIIVRTYPIFYSDFELMEN